MREERVGGPQQIDDIRGGRAHLVGRLVVVGVGGPDVAQVSPGQDEHHPPVDRRRERDRPGVSYPLPGHRHMDAFGEAQQRLRPRVVEATHLIDPRPRRVHDHEGPHRARPTAQRVVHGGTADTPVGLDEPGDLGIARDQRARLSGAAHGRDDEASIVRLRVVVQRGALQLFLPQRRLEAHGCGAPQPTVRLHVAEGREEVV